MFTYFFTFKMVQKVIYCESYICRMHPPHTWPVHQEGNTKSGKDHQPGRGGNGDNVYVKCCWSSFKAKENHLLISMLHFRCFPTSSANPSLRKPPPDIDVTPSDVHHYLQPIPASVNHLPISTLHFGCSPLLQPIPASVNHLPISTLHFRCSPLLQPIPASRSIRVQGRT